MSRPGRLHRWREVRGRFALTTLIACWMASAGEAQLIETVRVVTPTLVVFDVPNVEVVTVATGGPSTISFDQAVLRPGRALRISVRADSDLTPPTGPGIPATSLSWTTANAINGVGVSGTLTKNTYRTVYESTVGATSGGVEVTWRVLIPNKNIRAGTHLATLRWRLEAF